ncbi:MAG TPA: outer membrane lipoprotein carrier protein LolA, partial [Vicinamibacteria bacterium]|nr:outer membrane lipoprotein carrier protein LolA [Vicinamibacteria bacterium]
MAFAMIAFLVALEAPPAPKTAAEYLAQRIEERQAAARDLVARFVQTYRSGVLRRTLVERGEVKVKRPGRMRWEYKDPERKTFV